MGGKFHVKRCKTRSERVFWALSAYQTQYIDHIDVKNSKTERLSCFFKFLKQKNTLSSVYNDNDTKEQSFSMYYIEAKEKYGKVVNE